MGLQSSSLTCVLLMFCMFASNQSVMAARWINDGSPQISSNGNQVISSGPRGPHNALWEDGEGVSSGQHYWQLQVTRLLEEASVFVGVTEKSRLKPGYDVQGLFYGSGAGNLADGSRLLVSKFGPGIKSGDSVGIFVSFEQGNIKVYFDVNGVSLGLAYDIPSSIFNGVYPVVTFSGEGSLKITKVTGQPQSLTRVVKTGVEDHWVLLAEEFNVNGSVRQLPLHVEEITLNIEQLDGVGEYRVVFHVWNGIGTALKYKDGKWTSSGIWSTRIATTSEVRAFEQYIYQLTTNPTKIELVENGSYLVWENTNENIYSKWKRSPGPGPVTKDPFN